MKKMIALLLTASLMLALFGCATEPAETTIPTQLQEEQIRAFYEEFIEVDLSDPVRAIEEYVHYNDETIKAVAIDSVKGNYTTHYEILGLEKITDQLWAIELYIETSMDPQGFNAYNFVGEIDGVHKVIRGVNQIPQSLIGELDLDAYLPTEPAETIPETTVPETTLPQTPAESVNLNELIAGSDVELSVEGSAITLNEDGMTLELSTDSLLAYRNGYVAAVLKDIPTVIGGNVYVHEDFCNDFLCAEEAEQPSLFHGVLFFAEEILAAIDGPEASAFNQKVAADVLLPSSRGIETPNVDMLRVFSTSPLSGMPEILAQELERLGYENPEQYTYGEYSILSGAQTLAQAGISDDAETTVAEYQRRQRARDQQTALDELTEEQKAFAAEKGIELSDLTQLRKVFYGAYMEQTDEALKQALEEYYAMNLSALRDMAEADDKA